MAILIEDVDSLRQAIKHGQKAKFLFFWGHRPTSDGSIGKGCLSQWRPARFEVEGVRYGSAEHFMMAEKARLFGDEETRRRIITAKSPSHAKTLGRSVSPFDERTWCERRFAIVVAGNMAKFSQNADLQAFLLGTRERVLVEASPRDRIWGIGLAEDNTNAQRPEKWRGLNLLGFALMEVRRRLVAKAAA